MDTQTMMILSHLENKGSITSLEAIELYGCTRLSARIWDLRNIYDEKIRSERVTVKNRFGDTVGVTRYTLDEEATA